MEREKEVKAYLGWQSPWEFCWGWNSRQSLSNLSTPPEGTGASLGSHRSADQGKRPGSEGIPGTIWITYYKHKANFVAAHSISLTPSFSFPHYFFPWQTWETSSLEIELFIDHPGSSPHLWSHWVLTDDTQYNNWDSENFLHTSLPVLLHTLPPSPNVSGVHQDGITQRTSEYLPIGFQAKFLSAEFLQRWAKSNSDYNKPKLCLVICGQFPGVQVLLKQMLVFLLH